MAKTPGFKKFRKTVTNVIDALRADIETMRAELDITRKQLAEASAASDSITNTVHQAIAAIDERVSQMGKELTNQLHELGNDIDKLEGQSDSSIAETVAHIHSTQIRLAAEQARYEIVFRQDLAELADHLRRQR
jgi:hypothetical protein